MKPPNKMYCRWVHDPKSIWARFPTKKPLNPRISQPIPKDFADPHTFNEILNIVNDLDVLDWKFIEISPNVEEDQHWYGDFLYKEKQCVLVILHKEHIYCMGTDDFDMAIRGLTPIEGKKIFAKIKKGITKQGLRTLGLKEYA